MYTQSKNIPSYEKLSYEELSYDTFSPEEQERRASRARRIQRMKKQKARRILFLKCRRIALLLIAVVLIASLILTKCGKNEEKTPSLETTEGTSGLPDSSLQQSAAEQSSETLSGNSEETKSSSGASELPGDSTFETENTLENNINGEETANTGAIANEQIIYSAAATEDTLALSSEIVSENALLIDLDTDQILAQKAAKTIISPASMTKVLTVLVAAEQIQEEQLDDTFTMTLDITDYSYVNDCSNAGFLENEAVTVRDLFYGTILPSGADAAVGLAVYVAGSHEAFVDLMNEKLKALGLSDTAHMTNCVGIYDEAHYCTVYDMAMIMEAAIENELCREVLGTRIYTTSATAQHPEGITLSNWFIRRIEDKDTGGQVLGAKTGYVNQSGSCAVSYARDNGGKEYVCVTAHASSSWRCIYDHVALYQMFATGGEAS